MGRKEKMNGRTTIEYDAQMLSESLDDRLLSYLNCFWMATDSEAGALGITLQFGCVFLCV